MAASNAARATPTPRAATLTRPSSRAPRIWGRPWPRGALGATEHGAGRDPVVDVGHLDGLDPPVSELVDVTGHLDAARTQARLLLDDEAGDSFLGAGREGHHPRTARPLVTHILVPLITYSSPSRSA